MYDVGPGSTNVGCWIRGGKVKEILSFIIVWGIASLLWKLQCPIPYWLSALKQYPYFMAGHYFSQYCLLDKGWLNAPKVKTISIIMYVLTMAFVAKSDFHFISLTGIFAIVIIMGMFARYSERIPNWISYVGKYSMEIYVLHWFFLPEMTDWGKYIMMHDNFNGNMVLVSICCMCVCPVIMAFCLIVAKILKQSSLLGFICFGSKKNE